VSKYFATLVNLQVPLKTSIIDVRLITHLKSRKNVRKKTLGKDGPPEARNTTNNNTGKTAQERLK